VTRTRALTLVFAAALLASVAAACGGTTTPTGATIAPGPTPTPAPTVPASSGTPTDTPAPTEPGQTVAPTAPAGSSGPTASASDSPGAADACSGTDDNRRFYRSLAQSVTWSVVCPVLPKGWFVNKGTSRLAGGGKILITYTGPAGASLALSEGFFCTAADGCVPSGADAGTAPFGSMSGTTVALDDGGWAIVVNRGASPSWLLVGHGMDQAGLEAIAAALAEVAG
jgi:hypothetical protein